MILFDERPRVLTVRYVDESSNAEFEDYLARLTEHVKARRTPMVTIFDLSQATPNTYHRVRQTAWLMQYRALADALSLGTAFVVRSSVPRALLTTILWAAPIHQPYVFVPTLTEAEAWANERLREADAAGQLKPA